MALVRDNSALWQDIKDLYTSLNTTASKFGMSQSTVPEKKETNFVTANVTDLKTLVQALSSNKYIGNAADTSGVTVPVRDAVIQPTGMTQLRTIIETSNAQCIHDASYNSSYNTSYRTSYNASYNASYRTSYQTSYQSTYNSSYNATYRTSYQTSYQSTYNSSYNASYDSSYDSSFRGSYNSSYDSSFRSSYQSTYDSSFRSGYDASFRGSYNSSCASQCSGGSFRFTGSFR